MTFELIMRAYCYWNYDYDANIEIDSWHISFSGRVKYN